MCPDPASRAHACARGERVDLMSDDMIEVRLVGGPMDGSTLPVPSDEMDDPAPGFDFVPPDESSAPPGYFRVLYTAEDGGPPDVWHWRSWVP